MIYVQIVKVMKTKDYQIISLGKQVFLVVILSFEMTNCYWAALQTELARYNIADAEVYFDFLYRNGLKNRFYKTKLLEGRLLNGSLKRCEVPQECISEADNFFALNIEMIEHSVLSSSQKKFIRMKLNVTV